METINHFQCFDYMIDSANDILDEDFIKNTHKILKTNTSDSRISWFNVGEYKSRKNMVGDLITTPPEKVKSTIEKLLNEYNKKQTVSFDDILDFHVKFERIHPFQDGNGRTGRMILYRECLRQNIMPFIIHNENRIEYISSLNKAQTGGDYADLVTLFEKEQLKYTEIYEYFNVEARYKYYLDNTEEDITIGEVGESAPRI